MTGDLWGVAPNSDGGIVGFHPTPQRGLYGALPQTPIKTLFRKRVLIIPKNLEKMFLRIVGRFVNARDIGEIGDISDSRDACPYKGYELFCGCR